MSSDRPLDSLRQIREQYVHVREKLQKERAELAARIAEIDAELKQELAVLSGNKTKICKTTTYGGMTLQGRVLSVLLEHGVPLRPDDVVVAIGEERKNVIWALTALKQRHKLVIHPRRGLWAVDPERIGDVEAALATL